MNYYNIIWFLVAAIAAAIPIPFIKLYTETRKIVWVILSFFSYAILILAYSIILTDKNITIIYPILKVLSVIIVVIAGLFLFNNVLDIKSILGIFLGIASIYLLSSKIDNKI